MNDDQLLLANAYLDDEIDDDERSRAEADAEVMAEVGRLRALRDELRAVEAPDRARRDRSLAAALAAFNAEADEDVPTDRRSAEPTMPVPLPHRPRRAWWGVGAAAAALVLVVGAGVALRGGGSNGDDSGDSAELLSAATEAARAGSDAEDSAAATEAPADGEGAAPEATSAAGAGGSLTPTADAGPGTTTVLAAPAAAIPPVLNTVDDLRGYVSRALEDPPSPPATCEQDGTFSGRVLYAGTLVEVFTTSSEIAVVDAVTCAVVERVGR